MLAFDAALTARNLCWSTRTPMKWANGENLGQITVMAWRLATLHVPNKPLAQYL
jgi:hypothetical protein